LGDPDDLKGIQAKCGTLIAAVNLPSRW